MDIEEIQHIARLTKEETEVIMIFRSLDEIEQKRLIEQINNFTYKDDEE